MKRLVLLSVLAILPVFAQEAEHAAEGHEAAPPIEYKWINFVILAAGLGYLIVSKGMPALNERGRDIQKALQAAEQIKADAANEEAAIDRKLAALESEMQQLRASARAEMDAESKRLQAETDGLLTKLQANAASEIATMTKQSENALKAKASELALTLARQKVAAKMNAQTDAGLVAAFVQDLKKIQEARN